VTQFMKPTQLTLVFSFLLLKMTFLVCLSQSEVSDCPTSNMMVHFALVLTHITLCKWHRCSPQYWIQYSQYDNGINSSNNVFISFNIHSVHGVDIIYLLLLSIYIHIKLRGPFLPLVPLLSEPESVFWLYSWSHGFAKMHTVYFGFKAKPLM